MAANSSESQPQASESRASRSFSGNQDERIKRECVFSRNLSPISKRSQTWADKERCYWLRGGYLRQGKKRINQFEGPKSMCKPIQHARSDPTTGQWNPATTAMGRRPKPLMNTQSKNHESTTPSANGPCPPVAIHESPLPIRLRIQVLRSPRSTPS